VAKGGGQQTEENRGRDEVGQGQLGRIEWREVGESVGVRGSPKVERRLFAEMRLVGKEVL
jgi:hypothetical protein